MMKKMKEDAKKREDEVRQAERRELQYLDEEHEEVRKNDAD